MYMYDYPNICKTKITEGKGEPTRLHLDTQ